MSPRGEMVPSWESLLYTKENPRVNMDKTLKHDFSWSDFMKRYKVHELVVLIKSDLVNEVNTTRKMWSSILMEEKLKGQFFNNINATGTWYFNQESFQAHKR